MSALKGKNAIIYAFSEMAGGYVPFRCAESFTLSRENELINVTSVGSGDTNKVRYRRYSWSITLDGVAEIGEEIVGFKYVNNLFHLDFIKLPLQIQIEYTDPGGEEMIISGTVLIETADLQAPQDDFVNYSLSMRGTGAYTLTASTIPGSGGTGGVGFGIIGSTFTVG